MIMIKFYSGTRAAFGRNRFSYRLSGDNTRHARPRRGVYTFYACFIKQTTPTDAAGQNEKRQNTTVERETLRITTTAAGGGRPEIYYASPAETSVTLKIKIKNKGSETTWKERVACNVRTHVYRLWRPLSVLTPIAIAIRVHNHRAIRRGSFVKYINFR